MASSTIDLAEEERLAASYAPETTGPLVDEPRPLQDMAEQWTGAHPTIQAKLQKLPATYPAWRRLRGDGSCGFRAVLFGWFEVWVRRGDAALLREQTDVLAGKWTALGIDELFTDWIDSVTGLAGRVAAAMEEAKGADPVKAALAVLMATFNDDDEQRDLMQCLRMMTSSEMRANAEQYQASLDAPLEQWCRDNVDVPSAEMDFPSLVAAYNAVARPAGVALHIIYLDSSTGDDANVHDLVPDGDLQTGREIWMLYRPGHYDLVYKA